MIRQHPFHFNQIRFRDMVPGVQQRLGQIAVVGQQHQPLTIKVQPSHRKDSDADSWQKVFHCWPATRIIQSGHDIPRFIEDEVGIRLHSLQMPAIHFHVVTLRINASAELANHSPVHGHVTRGDHLLRLPPRREARTGDQFLKPN